MADNYIENKYEQYQIRKAAWIKSGAKKKQQKKVAANQGVQDSSTTQEGEKPVTEVAEAHIAPAPSGYEEVRKTYMHNHVKRVVAVHDLSGAGRVSLMAVIPILSTMGIQVCPLPTAVLSAHTQYPYYSFLDLTEEMKNIISNWEKLNMKFDTFYTGYLGSPQQVKIVEDFICKFRRPQDMVVVDPVLGDNGNLYKGITEEMVTEMKKLIKYADVITPNMTEVFRLLDIDYKTDVSTREMKSYLKQLSDAGPDIVIATSVPVEGNPHATSVYAYNRHGDRYWKVTCPYLPAHYPGTGDTFTSVITGSLMQGDSLPIALDRASQFILQGIRATFGYEYNNLDGIMLEKILHNLDMPIQISSYEVLE